MFHFPYEEFVKAVILLVKEWGASLNYISRMNFVLNRMEEGVAIHINICSSQIIKLRLDRLLRTVFCLYDVICSYFSPFFVCSTACGFFFTFAFMGSMVNRLLILERKYI